MGALDDATGAAFDRRWITLMTSHHTSAVAMAKTEFAHGQNAMAKELACLIIASQCRFRAGHLDQPWHSTRRLQPAELRPVDGPV